MGFGAGLEDLRSGAEGWDFFTLRQIVGFWQEGKTVTHLNCVLDRAELSSEQTICFLLSPKHKEAKTRAESEFRKGFWQDLWKGKKVGACNIEEERVKKMNCQMCYKQHPGAMILVLLGLPCVKYQKKKCENILVHTVLCSEK